MEIIECVPNFSEGYRSEVIEAIRNKIDETNGCKVLHVDSNISTNRTVYTFVGSRDSVINGALNAAKCAHEKIDMTKHRKNEHPRFGALDVCPFIPVKNVKMEECIQCANDFAQKLADELRVPVFLYGEAAGEDDRRDVNRIRDGEYEGLEKKLEDRKWRPDFGPNRFLPKWGATAVGARKFLISYNVNLISTKEQAHQIALNVRNELEASQSDSSTSSCFTARGSYLETMETQELKHEVAQVMSEIKDTDHIKIHRVFELVLQHAEQMKLAVLGSQIEGLVPLQSLLDVAKYYSKRNQLIILDERSKIQYAIHKLGLNQFEIFDPDTRIIEYITDESVSTTSLELNQFIKAVGRPLSMPSGGSVSAATAAMGAALCSMFGQLSYHQSAEQNQLYKAMRKNISTLHECMSDLLPLVNNDEVAFDGYAKRLRLDENVDGDRVKQGAEKAVKAQLEVMKVAGKCWNAIKVLAEQGNIQCFSDIQIGAKSLETGIWGTYQKVLMNSQMLDEERRQKLEEEGESMVEEAKEKCAEILKVIEKRKDRQEE